MRRIICCFLLFILTSTALAEENDYVGFLTRLKTTPEEFFMMMKNSWATRGWVILGGDHTTSKAKFYDTLMLMQMSLNRGDIDEMILPDFTAEYLMNTNSDYEPCCISNSDRMNLCFGFLKENRELLNKWNRALISMRNDNTLAGLNYKYVKNIPGKKDRIKFEKYKDAPTVKVAVTGDLPPVDFISEEGLPTGYNVAVLSEIGKRLRINILPVNVETGARTAALVSGRADVVFWYEINKSFNVQPDVPNDILLSEPYFEWNQFIHLTLKER